MAYSNEIVEKAALLHDIGKVLLRAKPGKGTHEVRGIEFLSPYVGDTVEEQALLRAIGHHHQTALKELQPPIDDLSYLIYEADNMAAGTDRRKNEAGGFGFAANKTLENIFNIFGETRGKASSFYVRPLLDKEGMSYPEERTILASSAVYQQLVDILRKEFQQYTLSGMTVQDVLQVLEKTMSYVPSSTATDEVADISLYDHLKITAAYAVCMSMYFQAQGIRDYKSWCYGNKQKKLRETPMYLLVSGDISGIQDFIYTIPSKGALKSLRGRSFYLDFLLEHIVDEILQAVGVSRSCLLYTGGGHFYMLLPNIPSVVALLDKAAQAVNDWFIQYLGNRLYLAMAWTPCTANEFMDIETNRTANVFRRVSQLVGKRKLQRYNETQLNTLFQPMSHVNRVREGTRECAVCHQSVPEQDLSAYEDGDENACSFCRNLLALGKGILDGDVVIISALSSSSSIPMPGLDREWYARTINVEALRHSKAPLRRIYVKNDVYLHQGNAMHVWVGDYTSRNETGNVLDFETLAMYSGGSLDATGIKRLGVMRADVDNLGAAFLSGFTQPYDTLSRKAALSRQLSFFFKRYINDICAGRVNGIQETEYAKTSLFGDVKPEKRFVHIIYSGGDDMFLVGAWDELIELAVDIYHKFSQFTNGKLTFSAGIGFFNPACPISEMARATGRLEDRAKRNPGKDSIMLFGQTNDDMTIPHVYSWKRFIQKVCKEKISFWQHHFQDMDGKDKRKLPIGKSGMYRLLSLLRDDKATKSINLARFAYVLARMEPQQSADISRIQCYNEVRTQLYTWYMQQEDRHELFTALQLEIYRLREKE